MSKKKTGLLIALGAAIGAAAAGISYYLKYKSFNDELDKDFHDYEDEETPSGEAGKGIASCSTARERTYITLEPGKCRTGEEHDAEGPNAQEPAPEPAPLKEAPEAGTDTASPAPAKSATVEEDTDGAGK